MGQPLLARFPMEGSVSGHHRSPPRGSSVEFAEYRNYVPGDDIRRLDWRVFARTDRYYLKEFEAETNLRCYVVLDCSGSMGFAGEHGTRLDYAKRLAATLSYLIINQGDAAGLLHVTEKTATEIPPRRNASHLQVRLDDARSSSSCPTAFAMATNCGTPCSTCVFKNTTLRCFTCSTRSSWTSSSTGRCGSWTWRARTRLSPSRPPFAPNTSPSSSASSTSCGTPATNLTPTTAV